jgi:hypothetical protein
MFETRIRVLEAGVGSYLGIVEGFPDILVHATTATEAEADTVRAIADLLERMMCREETRLQFDGFPTVRVVRIHLTSLAE